MNSTPDVLIVGAGIVGLTLARELSLRGAGSIVVLEKELRAGVHASGRNSGVLHSGIYYGADTLKAKVCARGSRMMQSYAAERGIPVERTGKVILATTAQGATQLDRLMELGAKNGIPVQRLSAEALREAEPEAAPQGKAVFSPTTAVIDSGRVLEALQSELRDRGVELRMGCGLEQVDARKRLARAGGESLSYGSLVNAAGLHADRVAHWMGVGERYEILPFKGLYRFLTPAASRRFRGSLYPVPDLRMPFLGVHITRGVGGAVSVGPTAIPAFGRENYGIFEGIRPRDGARMASVLGRMVALNRQGLRDLVLSEVRHYTKPGLLAAARRLAPRLSAADLSDKTKVGLRAQLVDRVALSLVMDFVVEEGPSSVHILNAISPAFTSSFALAEILADRVMDASRLPPP